MSEQSKFVFGKGITITTGFDVSTQLPLDSRTVVGSMDDLANISKSVIYEGLLVFVIEEDKLYQWKRSLLEDGTLSKEYGWGPIEAEVSTKEIRNKQEIDFNNTPPLMMQKNKKDFFPIVHEDFLYVDKDGKVLADKYQTIYDENLPEGGNKTIVGTINSINTKLDDAIADFNEEIQNTIDNLNSSVAKMKADTEEEMAAMKAKMQKDIDDTIAALNGKSQEFEKQLQSLEQEIKDDIDQMLQDVDNSILSDDQVNDLMQQIQKNISDINSLSF